MKDGVTVCKMRVIFDTGGKMAACTLDTAKCSREHWNQITGLLLGKCLFRNDVPCLLMARPKSFLFLLVCFITPPPLIN